MAEKRTNFVKEIDLLSNLARVQIPWVKVTIGDVFTFGVFDRHNRALVSSDKAIYTKAFEIEYPNYIQSLKIKKINGQINKYSLVISYPITQFDDPNFFEKVFSKASQGRKIKFSYGDISNPGYIYKEEEAIITRIGQVFTLESSKIDYTIEAISSASLKITGNTNFIATGKKVKPSDEIKRIFREDKSLQNVFTGMATSKLDMFIAGDDEAVELQSKEGVSVLDYISYLVNCMRPVGSPAGLPVANYILTIHDNSPAEEEDATIGNINTGPYFKVTKVDKNVKQGDAYNLYIGYNTSTIVTNFAIEQNENYALYYDYQNQINPKKYVRRLTKQGQWEDVYAPAITTTADMKQSTAADENWWKLITAYPINATVTIIGLLKPVTLMQYIRLHVVFPGGHKHISSGLYLITSQEDTLDKNGYKTTLGLTKIAGDDDYKALDNSFDSMYSTLK